MADLNIQTIDADGLTPAFAAAAGGGDHLQLGTDAFAVFRNGSGGSITVTFVTPGDVSGLAVADRAVVVAAGAEAWVALDSSVYKDPTTDRAHVTYSGVTSLTVGVFQR